MKILGIDTTAKSACVAVLSDGKIISSFYTNTGLTHSQTLLPMVDTVLKSANYNIGDIDYFAVNNGPGSFTGVRIGVSAVKGMAQFSNKPCVEVSTLESLAYNLIDCDCIAVSAMDARCNQVYTASFLCRRGEVTRLSDDEAVLIDEMEERLKEYDVPIIFVGDGAMLCYEYYKQKINCSLSCENSRYQDARSVVLAAERKIASGKTVSAEKLEPLYLRLPQAERELKKKEKLK